MKASLRRPKARRPKPSRLLSYPTLRQTWPRERPGAAICVQDVNVQCVLQFTLIHAAGCALHRHTSRVIHRLEFYLPYRSPRSVRASGADGRPRRRPRGRVLRTLQRHMREGHKSRGAVLVREEERLFEPRTARAAPEPKRRTVGRRYPSPLDTNIAT